MAKTAFLIALLAPLAMTPATFAQGSQKTFDDILRTTVQIAQGITVEDLRLTAPGLTTRTRSNSDDLATLFTIILGGESVAAASDVVPLSLNQRYNNQIELSGSLPPYLTTVTLDLIARHHEPLIVAGLDSNGESLTIESRTTSGDTEPVLRQAGERVRSQRSWNIGNLSIGQNDILIFVLNRDDVARQAIRISLFRGSASPTPTRAPASADHPTQHADSVMLDRDGWRQVQISLIQEGYDAGTPDGIPGPKTRSAIRSWQRTNGLDPTGYLDASSSRILLSTDPASPFPPGSSAR